MIVISVYQFYDIQYRCEGYIFWRQVDPIRNDSDIEIKQISPSQAVKAIIENLNNEQKAPINI
jgi:hypothetical protein